MEKDFQKWHSIKELLENKEKKTYFQERDIWWCSLGLNLGFEEDGKNEQFERPVLVLKKINNDLMWVLPLTRTEKIWKYYFQIEYEIRKSSIILSQLRTISKKRLLRKMRMISGKEFNEIRNRVKNLL